MSMVDLPAGVEYCALDSLPLQPWRNGVGLTRAVAEDAQAAWRVSCADVIRDGAYSAFQGMDRQQVLLAGGPVLLHAPGWHAELRHALDDARFPGEAAVHACVPQEPARMWNIMVARGRAAGQVLRLPSGPARLRPQGGELLRVLHVVDGTPRLGGRPLVAGSILVCRPEPEIDADAMLIVAPGDVVLVTRISACQP